MAQLELSSGNLVEIADQLFDFVRDEVVPGTGFTAEAVFQHLGELVEEFEPRKPRPPRSARRGPATDR